MRHLFASILIGVASCSPALAAPHAQIAQGTPIAAPPTSRR